MSNLDTPEAIARLRMVNAEAVLENRVDLRGYPYRNLAIRAQRGFSPERVTTAVAAAEVLDRFGWELLNVAEFGTTRLVYAFLRRR